MVLPFLTVYLTQELQFTFKEAGWVMSCWGAGSVAGAYLGGRFTDKWGYYPVMFWSLIVGGGFLVSLVFVKTLLAFCMAIFLTSTIVDLFRPASMAAIGAYSTPERQTRAITLYRFAINLGFASGPALGGILAGKLGYEVLFIADGITCVLAAVFFISMLPNKKEVDTTDEKESSDGQYVITSPYQDSIFLIFVFCALLAAISFMQMFATIPVFLKTELLMSESTLGLFMGLNGLIIIVVEMPLIYLLENKYKQLTVVAGGMLLLACSYGFLMLNPAWLWVPWVFMILLTISEMIMFPFSSSFALSRTHPSNRGQFMGLYSMSFSIAQIIGPVMGMFIAENFGFNMLWVTLTSFALAGSIGTFWLIPLAHPKPSLDQEANN